jgi:voltage-gated potassium channel
MESPDTPTAEATETASPQRREAVIEILVGIASLIVLMLAYFLLPLDLLAGLPVVLTMTAGLVVLAVFTFVQVRSVVVSRTPGARAAGALMQSIPFFLLLFAAEYYVIASGDPTVFSQSDLSRMDMLYFTVTVFATVGFGDIVPTGQVLRGLVTFQMILDLIVIGAVVKVFVGAVQKARTSPVSSSQA